MNAIKRMFFQLVYLFLIPVTWLLAFVLPVFLNLQYFYNTQTGLWSYKFALPVYLNWFMSEKSKTLLDDTFFDGKNIYVFALVWFIKNPANGFYLEHLES